MTMRSDLGAVAVYVALLVFGVGYNALIHHLEQRGYAEGYTAILVVGGVAITLGGVATLNYEAAMITLGAFAASGLPMVIGSMYRHATMRARAQKAMRDDATKGVGK
jgi:hypothetical protein